MSTYDFELGEATVVFDFWEILLGEKPGPRGPAPLDLIRPCRGCGCGETHHAHYSFCSYCSRCGWDKCSYFRPTHWWHRIFGRKAREGGNHVQSHALPE